MCGLVGVAGYISHNETKAFRDMLQLDVVRGPHSTGIVTASPNDGASWAKAAMLPQDFFDTRQYKATMNGVKTLIMGHNRFATVGKISTATAHPFAFDNIIGMHNGTLRNWKNTLDNGHDFNVDSECLLSHMNEHGLDIFEKLEGAYALTWYDERDDTLNMLRNDQRTLVTRMSKDQRTMFYASESWMIQAACWRNGVQLADPVYDVTPGKHFKWKLPPNGATGLGKPSLRKVNTYTPPPAVDYYDRRGASFGKPPAKVHHLPDRNQPLRKKVGTEVQFYAVDWKELNPQTKFGVVECIEKDNAHVNVHIRCHETDSKDLLDWDGYFSGKPTSFVGESYNHRTGKFDEGTLIVPVHLVTYREDKEEIIIAPKGPKGNDLTEQEFDKLTKDGCAYCSGNILYGEAVYWWNNEPFCEDCEEEFSDAEGETSRIARVH